MVNNFLHCLGIYCPSDYSYDKWENYRLKGQVCALKELFNENYYGRDPNEKIYKIFEKCFLKLNVSEFGKMIQSTGCQKRIRIVESYLDGNRRLAEDILHMDNRTLFECVDTSTVDGRMTITEREMLMVKNSVIIASELVNYYKK